MNSFIFNFQILIKRWLTFLIFSVETHKKVHSATKKHSNAKKTTKMETETDTKSGKSTIDDNKSKSAKKQQITRDKGKKS